jgi:hypothetical protein
MLLGSCNGFIVIAPGATGVVCGCDAGAGAACCPPLGADSVVFWLAQAASISTSEEAIGIADLLKFIGLPFLVDSIPGHSGRNGIGPVCGRNSRMQRIQPAARSPRQAAFAGPRNNLSGPPTTFVLTCERLELTRFERPKVEVTFTIDQPGLGNLDHSAL